MDRVTQLRKAVFTVLKRYQGRWQKHDSATIQVVHDKATNLYQMIRFGWASDTNFVFYSVYALQIRNGKIWLLENRTDVDITEDLMELGVDRMDIVLGFIPEHERPYTDYAVS